MALRTWFFSLIGGWCADRFRGSVDGSVVQVTIVPVPPAPKHKETKGIPIPPETKPRERRLHRWGFY